jgi:hypothetical protein
MQIETLPLTFNNLINMDSEQLSKIIDESGAEIRTKDGSK